jgi:hypothetical protein
MQEVEQCKEQLPKERKEVLYYENTQQLCDLCASAVTLATGTHR